MELKQFDKLIKETLRIEDFKNHDYAANGLQVARENQEIKKAAFAVDASLATFKMAKEQNADLIFTHHGLFWKKNCPQVLTGFLYKRISYLIKNDLGLYAVHLPLDAHPELGNNAQICHAFGIHDPQPFGFYKGIAIGLKGQLTEPIKRDEIASLLGLNPGEGLSILPFGKELIKSIGIVSGGATENVQDAIDADLDLFITGESSHQAYHTCLEAGINMLSGGHYQTEIGGVKALADFVSRETELETVFIDLPTGL